jgi:hypothetical protein
MSAPAETMVPAPAHIVTGNSPSPPVAVGNQSYLPQRGRGTLNPIPDVEPSKGWEKYMTGLKLGLVPNWARSYIRLAYP